MRRPKAFSEKVPCVNPTKFAEKSISLVFFSVFGRKKNSTFVLITFYFAKWQIFDEEIKTATTSADVKERFRHVVVSTS